MTKNDIIRMAQNSGLKFEEHLDEFFSPLCDGVYFEDLEDFANLVAAAEREACAKVCDARYKTHKDNYGGFIGQSSKISEAIDCAQSIRARGQG